MELLKILHPLLLMHGLESTRVPRSHSCHSSWTVSCKTFLSVHVLAFFFEKYWFPITFIISLPRRCITNKWRKSVVGWKNKKVHFCTSFIDSFIIGTLAPDINFETNICLSLPPDGSTWFFAYFSLFLFSTLIACFASF